MSLRRSTVLAVFAVICAAACSAGGSRSDAPATNKAAATADVPAAMPAAPPAPYVTEIPPWPADTNMMSTDRDGALPARLRGVVRACGALVPIVAADSVGPFYPGQPLANLFGACRRLVQLWHWEDGKYLPAVAVKMDGALLLIDASGVIPEAVVTRITALDGARTAEGIGHGSLLADAQRSYGVPTWRRDQCAVDVVFASRPGLLFHLAIADGAPAAYTCEDIRRFATGVDFRRFPEGSTIAWVAAELASN